MKKLKSFWCLICQLIPKIERKDITNSEVINTTSSDDAHSKIIHSYFNQSIVYSCRVDGSFFWANRRQYFEPICKYMIDSKIIDTNTQVLIRVSAPEVFLFLQRGVQILGDYPYRLNFLTEEMTQRQILDLFSNEEKYLFVDVHVACAALVQAATSNLVKRGKSLLFYFKEDKQLCSLSFLHTSQGDIWIGFTKVIGFNRIFQIGDAVGIFEKTGS